MQFSRITEKLSPNVTLVAVTKYRSEEEVWSLYHAGFRKFGENRVQDLLKRYETFPKDIDWHLIGHLQTNKVKYIAPFISMVQSVDSLKLLSQINKEAFKQNRIIPCLLQIHIADEKDKFGFIYDDLITLLNNNAFSEFKNVQIRGVMGMATLTDDKTKLREEFRTLYTYFTSLKTTYFNNVDYFTEVSMGMSNDYLIAVEEGATIVRIGSALFEK